MLDISGTSSVRELLATRVHNAISTVSQSWRNESYSALPRLFNTRLIPALKSLLDAAVAEGVIRAEIDAEELLHAVANLCRVSFDKESAYARRMVALLVDGMRYGATHPSTRS